MDKEDKDYADQNLDWMLESRCLMMGLDFDAEKEAPIEPMYKELFGRMFEEEGLEYYEAVNRTAIIGDFENVFREGLVEKDEITLGDKEDEFPFFYFPDDLAHFAFLKWAIAQRDKGLAHSTE